MVIYWLTVHYLGKRHKRSIAKVMKDHYARDSKTGCKGLYIYSPDKPRIPENRYFIWHKTLTRRQLGCPWADEVQDTQPYLNQGWVSGRSQQKKLETQAKANRCCECCGV